MTSSSVTASLQWLGPTATSRGWLSSGVMSLVLVIISAGFSGPLLRRADAARIGSLSGLHFEAAVSWVFCHRYGHTTSRPNLAEIADASSYDRSVVQLIEESTGSVA